jgi:formylglycine-generating enzyme required for sulfatase activity
MGTSDDQIDALANRDEVAAKWKSKGFFSREQPQHDVYLPDFSIAIYPVTVGEFRDFIQASGYHTDRYWTESGWTWRAANDRIKPDYWDEALWAGNDALPVVGVSWYEAWAYCRWLSDLLGVEYRLPTEAEWEKAARGAHGSQYPWGDVFDPSRCNTRSSGIGRTTPVGDLYPQDSSPYGCAEMAGNTSDWTQSKYMTYPYSKGDRRDDPEGDDERAIRGGAWFKPVIRARTAARGMNDPFFADHDVGFRLACDYLLD